MIEFLSSYIKNPGTKPLRWLQYGKSLSDDYRKNDLIFAWRSSRRIGIVGLGVAVRKDPYEAGEQWFDWKPTLMLPENSFIKLEEIRSALSRLPLGEQHPRFTRSGIVQTIYEVTREQAKIMLSLVMAKVPLDEKTKQVTAPLLAALGKGGDPAPDYTTP